MNYTRIKRSIIVFFNSCTWYKNAILFGFGLLLTFSSFAQTSDDSFKKPLKEVISEIESRFHVKIRYPEELVRDKWVTYAEWRFRNYSLDKTMSNILEPQDITYTQEGDKKYK